MSTTVVIPVLHLHTIVEGMLMKTVWYTIRYMSITAHTKRVIPMRPMTSNMPSVWPDSTVRLSVCCPAVSTGIWFITGLIRGSTIRGIALRGITIHGISIHGATIHGTTLPHGLRMGTHSRLDSVYGIH